jgi:hypothetical protein
VQTGNFLTRFYNKKITSFVEWRDRFLYWARDAVYDLRKAFLKSSLLSAVTVSGAGNNTIQFAAVGLVEGYDSGGEKIKVTLASLGTVAVPAQAATTWSVGFRQSLVETGVEINPRTGQPEYEAFQHILGASGTPDVYSLVGGKIRLQVNSVLHGNFGAPVHDYTGRQVRVWLKAKDQGGLGPLSPDPAVAFETRTVFFSGGNNWIELAAALGQTSNSTNPADYVVLALGPVVIEGALDPDDALPVCQFQNVAAANPITSFDHSVQRVVTFSLADLADVLRKDSHGRTKIRVVADPSDINEPQIEVIGNNSGAQGFAVDETGAVNIDPDSATPKDGLVASAGQDAGSGYGVKGYGFTAGVYGSGYLNSAGVQGVGGPDGGVGVIGQGTSDSAGVTGTGGPAGAPGGIFTGAGGGDGVAGTGQGNGAGGFFIGGVTGPALVTGRASNSNYLGAALHRALNGDVLDFLDHNGLPTSRVSVIRENWVAAFNISGAGAGSIAQTIFSYVTTFAGGGGSTSIRLYEIDDAFGTPQFQAPGAMLYLGSLNNNGDYASLHTTAKVTKMAPSTLMTGVWEAYVNDASTSRDLKHGFSSVTGTAGIGTEAGAFFIRRSTDTNWQAVTCNGASNTVTNTGVAPANNTVQRLRIEIYGSSTYRGAAVLFFINGALVATHTTNLPTTSTGMRWVAEQKKSTAGSDTYIIISPLTIAQTRHYNLGDQL